MLRGDCSICIHLGELNYKGASICMKCRDGSLWEVPFIEEEVVEMPAVSQKQQRYMAMVEEGKIEAPKGLTKKVAGEFAKTPRKGLPVKKGK